MLLHFIVFLKLPNLKTSRCMQYFHFVLKTNLCAKKRNTTHFVRYFFFATDYFKTCYRAFSCDVIAAMLEGKNDTFSLPWEMRSVFMQNCFIVSDYQHIHDQDNYERSTNEITKEMGTSEKLALSEAPHATTVSSCSLLSTV